MLLFGGTGASPVTPPAAAPSIETFGVDNTTANATNLIINPPADLASGDLWLVILGLDGESVVTTPAEFTFEDQGASTPRIKIYSRVATASESGIEFSWADLEQALAWSIRISGHNGFDLATFAGQSTTSYNSPNATPSFDNSLVIQVAFADDNNAATFNIDTVPGTPYTELGSQVRCTGTQGLVSRLVYDEEDASLITGGAWTQGSTRNSATSTIVISPS